MIIYSETIPALKRYSRVVSLVPSQTELLYDLGLEKEVIAITKFCIHPEAWYKNKKRIGGTKNLKIEVIKNINPDLIIANKEENVKEQVEELAKTFDVFVTDVSNLNDALKMIKNIGTLTGKTTEALNIANKIENKFQKLSESISGKQKIKTAYLIWKDPYMAAGGNTFINDMIQYCGLENIFTNAERYPEISLDDLQIDKSGESACELVLLSSEPYPFREKHLLEIKSKLPLIKITLADGEMFSWYGSRLLKAVDYFKAFRENISSAD
jgi:ABC-type Fe3+-hydroxamate transport system substrate-binding protein